MAHHDFTPQVYYSAMGSHEPVMHLADGDSVSTTTVDAGGGDASGEQATAGGNPQTGPFFIDGAEPGDTISVTFDKLVPNRKFGFASGAIAPIVLDPEFRPKFEDDRNRLEWEIDLENWTASPVGFDDLPLRNLKLPLDPMVGCFGVAPPRGQAISTATSSTHGGNMDYRRFVKDTTVYFPVFVEGALFHLGDGHALQGDGEIVGTGIEISFDVAFTVHLHKGKTIGWPRAENETHVMAVGNARPLDQALQHATTEMLHLLEQDYDLDARTIHILMGQAVEYEVGNFYDPAFTMVCKMSKDVLASIGAERQPN